MTYAIETTYVFQSIRHRLTPAKSIPSSCSTELSALRRVRQTVRSSSLSSLEVSGREGMNSATQTARMNEGIPSMRKRTFHASILGCLMDETPKLRIQRSPMG